MYDQNVLVLLDLATYHMKSRQDNKESSGGWDAVQGMEDGPAQPGLNPGSNNPGSGWAGGGWGTTTTQEPRFGTQVPTQVPTQVQA